MTDKDVAARLSVLESELYRLVGIIRLIRKDLTDSAESDTIE